MPLKRFYFTLDLRSLGLFRILFATVLIVDWFTRWPHLEAFYTSEGVFPNIAYLLSRTQQYRYSLLAGAETLPVVQFLFGIALACDTCVLLGIRTRFFWAASLILYSSILNRNDVISSIAESGVLALGLWGLFLPLAKRFSMDALLESKAQTRVSTDANDATDGRGLHSRASLAALALVLQLGLVYTLTAIAKTGEFWKSGTAVYYTLHLEHYTRPLGGWLAELPLPFLKLLNWTLLGLEWSAIALLLLPWPQPYLRWIFMLGLGTFHVATALVMDIGMIPYPFLVTFVVLWEDREWRVVERIGRRVSRLFRRAALRHRWQNLGASVQPVSGAAEGNASHLALSPGLARIGNRSLRLAANGVFALILLSVLTDSYNERIVSRYKTAPIREPRWMRAIIGGCMLNTRWNMFAPDPSTVNGWWVIRGVTKVSTEFDPLTGKPPVWTKPADVRGLLVPYWTRFMFRLSMGEFHPLRVHYARYLLRLNARMHRPEDRLERFDFYFVEERTLPPGSPKPFPSRPVYLWSYDRSTDRVTTRQPNAP